MRISRRGTLHLSILCHQELAPETCLSMKMTLSHLQTVQPMARWSKDIIHIGKSNWWKLALTTGWHSCHTTGRQIYRTVHFMIPTHNVSTCSFCFVLLYLNEPEIDVKIIWPNHFLPFVSVNSHFEELIRRSPHEQNTGGISPHHSSLHSSLHSPHLSSGTPSASTPLSNHFSKKRGENQYFSLTFCYAF